jgi:uncharacterized protein (TIGR03084 family)
MLEQAVDFRQENEALYELLSGLDGNDFATATQFKGWTINQIMVHLHLWNRAADLALADESAFLLFTESLRNWAKAKKGSMRLFELEQVQGLQGKALVDAWRAYYEPMASRFESAEPKQRVKWVGPDMSVRSSITARLMETWAHGQAIYDILGVARENKDRIKNIVVLGINTYGWAFQVRGLTPPEPKPYVKLEAPSGEIWAWGEVNENRIEGKAEEFCQVVTQTRNIADVNLMVKGETAEVWMKNAQCFAGGAEPPPAPKSRFMVKK